MFQGMRVSIIITSFLLFLSLYNIWSVQALVEARLEPEPKAPKNSVSAIYVFGDSTSDPGNNNYITTPFKSNFAPYGRDFPNHVATGRFTNGRLATDFIARYAGLKELVPPYMNASLSLDELMSGVSFASAGSGYDPLTPRLSGVIPLEKQLEYFKEYRSKLESRIGKEKVNKHISKAVFILSAGTNDFVVNYFTMPIRRRSYTIAQYQEFLVQNVGQFIQSLWDMGARKIAVAGIPPMGCLPVVITAKAKTISQRGCIDSISAMARDYNKLLQAHLLALQVTLADSSSSKIVYIDIYSPFVDLIQGRPIAGSTYSFEQVDDGCCGTGYLEAAFLCNRASYVCPDASKYVFWDSIHPTETTYYLLFKALHSVIDFIIAD